VRSFRAVSAVRTIPAGCLAPPSASASPRSNRAILLLKYQQMEPLGKWLAARPAEIARRVPRKHRLRNEERSEPVCGAFAIRKGGRVDNFRVLLLDDVMTAGATLKACARVEPSGCPSVVGLTEARAVRHANPVAGESES